MKITETSRLCPDCRNPLSYSSKYECNRAEKKNKVCYSCRTKRLLKDPEHLRKLRRGVQEYQSEYAMGETKRTCSDATKFKIQQTLLTNKPWTTQSNKGGDVYTAWVEKYGVIIANEKMDEFKQKQSISHTGKNNPMYGKPSPQGSGNGWSGWYKGWYFRSIHELSYMINVIEKNEWEWESAEQGKFAIPYTDWEGKQRTHFADFVINGKLMVECKPTRLHQSVAVKSKQRGAVEFCAKNNLTYRVECPILLDENELRILHDNEEIHFLERYEKKYDLLVRRSARVGKNYTSTTTQKAF